VRVLFSLKLILICLFAAVFVFCVGKKAPKQLSIQSSIRVEASFFRSNCVLCHGAEAEGKEMSERQIPSLREGAPVQKSDAELYKQISDGGNGMPPFKHQMTEQQIRNMVGFIRDLQKQDY
jgi:cytochrome c553